MSLNKESLDLLVDHYGKEINRTGHAKISVILNSACVDMLTAAFISRGYLVFKQKNMLTISK